MKNFDFLLTKKWVGALLFLIFSVCYSLYMSSTINREVTNLMPAVKASASDFLPITIEKGMISKPENTLIEKTYGDAGEQLKIVLDTRTEEFDPSNLTESGIYVSRSAVYSVNAAKNEVRINSLRDVPNMVIDEDVLNTVVSTIEEYIYPTVLAIVASFLVIWGLIVMGIYSLVLHWIMSAVYKAPYRRTLRLTVYSYIVFSLIGMFIKISSPFMLGFVFALAVNILANSWLKKQVVAEKTA